MKRSLRSILLLALAVAAANLLVSCAQSRNAAPNTAAATGAGAPPPPKSAGTSDSGGGTGVDGKVFESYIVNPMELKAYQEVLRPLFINLNGGPEAEKKWSANSMNIAKLKTWYIAPIQLEKISKDLLGVSFMKSETQQIARQTKKEIWIDKALFDAMSTQDQAELILHEITMSIYLLKFESFTTICQAGNMAGDAGQDCASMEKTFGKAFRPEVAHVLNDQDNENIRFVTGWILQNTQSPVAPPNFAKILLTKGFDKRIFGSGNYRPSSPPPDIQISGKELFRAIHGTQLTGHMPGQVVGLDDSREKKGTLSVQETSIAWKNFKLPGFWLKLQVPGEKNIEIPMYSDGTVTLKAVIDTDGETFYVYFGSSVSDQIHIGDRTYLTFLFFKKENASEQASLVLTSAAIKPGIVTSIDKQRTPICLTGVPKVIDFLDQGLLLKNFEDKTNDIQMLYAMTPPVAGCTSDNVVE